MLILLFNTFSILSYLRIGNMSHEFLSYSYHYSILYLKNIVILLCLFMHWVLWKFHGFKMLLTLNFNHNCIYWPSGQNICQRPGRLGFSPWSSHTKDSKNGTCLTLRYISRAKCSNPGKGVVTSSKPRCSSYWKRSLTFIYIYIYILFLGSGDYLTASTYFLSNI